MDRVRTINGYDLHERIGSGGFGMVYRATQTTVGREVAIKIVLPHFANQPDFIRRFETEAQIVARLEHLHVVPLYDYWRDPDGAYLVMRYMRGGSLRETLTSGPFELETAASFMDQIASALAMAHRNDVIHRDLKPANILLDDDGNAYLSDFGIAKDVARTENSQTEPGMVMGSPDYLSPEQARGEAVTPQTDIYSLGVMLYEVLTGEHPFPNLSSVERLYKHLNDPLPQIVSLSPEVVDGVNAIIQKATAKNPAERYSDVLEMAADFRRETDLSQRSPESIVEQLTLREQEVLQMITEGLSNKEIAENLFVTMATVKWHIRQLYQKLHVRSRVQAIMRARSLQLIGPDTIGEPALDEATYVALPEPKNPYKGLQAFQTADARDFFGREKLVQRLVKRLQGGTIPNRFLAVIGPSGSGKSSVIRAGLIPALSRGDLPGSERWFTVGMTPGTYPLDELEIALTRVAANQTANLHDQLERDSRGLVRVAGLILPDDKSELIVVVDQFEEMFTLVEDEARRVQFLELLYMAATDARSRVRVVITLRADFYDRPLHYPQFGEMVHTHMETVMPLSADELEAAIERPARRVGVAFEPGLVATITSDVHYQPGALPLLQYALTELFEQRVDRTLTHEAYQTLGGAAGALAQRAEELYRELDEAGRESIRQMFLRLVTLGEGVEDTRRRTPRSELLAVGGNDDQIDEVIDTYAAYRLLTLDHDPVSRRPTVEIAHEAILREWERLRGWLSESHHDIQQQRLLGAAAQAWRQNNQDKSYLLHGTRLTQLEDWAADSKLLLTAHEKHFLQACVAERERQFAAEHERQQHESALEKRAKRVFQVLTVVLLFAALGGFGLSAVALDREQQAQNARDQAQIERDRARDLALVNGAQAAQFKGDMDTALVLALEANRAQQPSSEAQALLSDIAYRPGTVRVLQTGGASIRSIAFLPDGKRIIVASALNDYLALWDVTTGEELLRYEGEGWETWSLALSPDGQYVLMGVGPGAFRMYEVETGQVIHRMAIDDTPFGIWALAISADGTQALAGSGWFGLAENNIVLWDLSTGQMIRSYVGAPAAVSTVRFDPDGRTFWAVGMGGIFHFDLESGDLLEHFGTNPGEHTQIVYDIQFSADGNEFYTTSFVDSTMLVWDAATRTVIKRYSLSEIFEIPHVYISPDQQSLLLQEGSSKLIWLDRQSLRELASLEGHTSLALSAAFSPDGRYAASGDDDGIIRVWDLSYGAEVSHVAVSVPPGWETKTWIAISADSQYAVLARVITNEDTEDQPVVYQVIDLQTGVEIGHFEPEGQVNLDSFVLALDGRTAYSSVSEDLVSGQFYEWDLLSGEISQQTVLPERYKITDVGETLLVLAPYSPNEETPIILWDHQAWQEQRRLTMPNTILKWGDLSRDERLLLTGTRDDEIILWDVTSGQEIHRFTGFWGGFEADGTILTTDAPQTITFRDAQTGQIIRQYDNIPVTTVLGHVSVFSVTLPDGNPGLVTLDTDSLIVWDQETGESIRRYNGVTLLNPSDVNHTAIVKPWPPPTGSIILSTWRIDSLPDLIQWAYGHRYVRDLTCTEHEKYQIVPYCD